MKRIYRAINEGINKSLIDFDCNDFKKTRPTTSLDIKEFHFGDYVLYNSKIGYNNYVGEKVAICVNDDPRKKLYVVLNHPLLLNLYRWANNGTKLDTDSLIEFRNGWQNTLYVLNMYKDEIKETIWELLKDNEYIPSIDELKIIYDNCSNSELWDIIGFLNTEYWSSSLFHIAGSQNHSYAFYIGTYNSYPISATKDYTYYRSIALLHLDV